jgi:cell division protein ZapA
MRAEVAEVVVTVNGRPFTLACGDGEEARTRRLAQYVDDKIADFVRAAGQAGEAQLLLLAALVIADELSDANDALAEERGRSQPDDPDALAGRVERLAERLEGIAAQLESP